MYIKQRIEYHFMRLKTAVHDMNLLEIHIYNYVGQVMILALFRIFPSQILLWIHSREDNHSSWKCPNGNVLCSDTYLLHRLYFLPQQLLFEAMWTPFSLHSTARFKPIINNIKAKLPVLSPNQKCLLSFSTSLVYEEKHAPAFHNWI